MKPHEADRFRNAATFTVAITFSVAGGARPDTARRRGERLAARLAVSGRARAADTAEVSARLHRGGVELRDEGHAVPFSSANTGLDARGAAGHRWIDPEHEVAQRTLAAADAAARAVRHADVERRHEVGCRNTSRLYPDWSCGCVYCRPLNHLEAATVCLRPDGTPIPLCPCGTAAERDDGRCQLHDRLDVVVLDHDPPELHELMDLENRDHGLELP